jgi:outer membrane protein assembly factor BamA
VRLFLRSLLPFILFSNTARAQQAPAFVIGNTWIHFRSDNLDVELPSSTVVDLARNATGSSIETIASELVRSLGNTHRYRDIVVNQAKDYDGRIHLLTSARTAWTLNSLKFQNTRGAVEDDAQLKSIIEARADQPILGMQNMDIDAIRIENSLKAQGFLKAKVKYLAKELVRGRLDVTFVLDRGNPCLIADFHPTLETLRVFRYIASGDRCNKTAITNQMREEESRLRNLGYINARMQFNPETDLIPTADLERATLRYKYSAGEKWSLQIFDRSTGAAVESDFMNKTGFVLGDLVFSDSEDLRIRIESYFKDLGYADIVVPEGDVDESTLNEKKLRFEVDKGPLLYVNYAPTEFVGDLAIPKAEAVKVMDLVPGFFDLGNGIPFVESELEKRRQLLQDHLGNLGYLQAVVQTPTVLRTAGSDRVQLRVAVSSGKRHIISRVVLLGKPAGFDESGIIADNLPENEPLRAASLNNFENVLRNEMQTNGWRAAKLNLPDSTCKKPEETAKKLRLICKQMENGDVMVEIPITIQPGPLFRIGKVTTGDIPFGKQDAVIYAAALRSGDILSSRQLANARDRVLKHGLFGTVNFVGADSLALSEDEYKEAEIFRDIVISAARPRNWNLTLNPSWSSDRGYGFQTDFRRNNISADGLQFFVQSTITQEPYQNTSSNGVAAGQVPGVSVSTGLREAFFRLGPWVTPFDFNFVTLGEEIDVRSERRETTRLQSDIAWRPYWFGMEFTHKVELSYSFSGYPLGGVSKPVKTIDQSNNVGALEISASTAMDTRNNPIWPRKGWILSLGVSHSNTKLGSDVDYDKFTGDYNQFYPLSRSWTQSFSIGGRHITSAKAPGNRREKISAFQVRGFPAIDSTLGPLLWYLETDTRGNCTAKLTQAAATNLFSARTESRFRPQHSNWATVLFYDAASSYFSQNQVERLNASLKSISADANSACPQSAAQVIGNDAVDLNLMQGGFVGDFARSSYQSAGIGLRFFLADMFALNMDWGFPTHDPSDDNTNCKPFSSPYGDTGEAGGAQVPPACISRRPNYFREWDSAKNVFQNSFKFLMRTQISIEGKF